MDKISKSLVRSVETGEYFQDARNWYAAKYLYPITERSFIAIIAIIVSVTLFMVLSNAYSLFPISKTPMLIVSVDDTTDEVARLRKLNAREDKTPSQAVFEFLATYFVKTYESYDYEKLEEQILSISNNSTKQVSKQFSDYISLDDPRSPVVLLQRTGRRNIEIQKVTLSQDIIAGDNLTDQVTGTAEVHFKATISDLLTTDKMESQWVAKLTIIASDIKSVLSGKVPFRFKVADYEVNPIKS